MANLSLVLLFLFTTRGAYAEVLHPLASDLQGNLRRNECGGSIRSDNHTLSYPGLEGENILPGETCVWTIHLEATRDFRFNFDQFDVNSADGNCSKAGIRLYSLSNLVSPGDMQQEVFCSGRPPRDSFYLAGTVAVLVVYSSAENSESGSGFTLSWRGTSFDPWETKHVTSFSTVESGVISYPVLVEYEPNLVGTWGFSTELGSDLMIAKVDLEDCPNIDACTCDALILYEVPSEGNGELVESDRFCRNSSVAINKSGIASNFLLAFFSDFHETSGGTGFSVVYFPSTGNTATSPSTTLPTSTSTTFRTTHSTTMPTSTDAAETTTSHSKDTPCGTILTENSGVISHAMTSRYEDNERCVWTIQVPRATSFTFKVTASGIFDPKDGILISTVFSNRYQTISQDNITNYAITENSGNVSLNGEVAFVTFYSNAANSSLGFELRYEVETISSVDDPKRGVIAFAATNVSHPPEPLTSYFNFELATFVYSFDFRYNYETDGGKHFAEYTKVGLEQISCVDRLNVFKFETLSKTWEPHSPFVICGETPSANYEHEDMLLFVFKSDNTVVGPGFKLNFMRIW